MRERVGLQSKPIFIELKNWGLRKCEDLTSRIRLQFYFTQSKQTNLIVQLVKRNVSSDLIYRHMFANIPVHNLFGV